MFFYTSFHYLTGLLLYKNFLRIHFLTNVYCGLLLAILKKYEKVELAKKQGA